MINFGLVPLGAVLPIPFATYGGTNGESITLTGLAVTDIEVYKGTSMTQRASDAGYALLDTDGIDIDGTTGIHGFSIDTSDNTDSGFYAAGSFYTVVVSAVTVDSQTVSFIAATFRLGPAEATAGVPVVDAEDSVWDASRTDHVTTGSFGEVTEAADIADAVLDEALSGHITAGTLGKVLSDTSTAATAIKAKTDNIPDDPADESTLAGLLGTPAGASLAADIAALVTTIGTPTGSSIAADIAGIEAGSGLDAAGVRAAIGLASANLDTQLSDLAIDDTVANFIADHVLKRPTASAFASSDGDGGTSPDDQSLIGAIGTSRHKRTRVGTNVTMYKPDGITVWVTDVIGTTAGLDPVSSFTPG